MTEQVKQPDVINPSGNTTVPSSGGSLTQMSSGPAALAQLLLYQTMAMYSHIISLNSEQKTKMLDAQKSEALGAATNAVKAGSQALMWALVGVGVSLTMTIAGGLVGMFAKTGEEQTASKELQVLEGKQTNLNTINEGLTSGNEYNLDGGADPLIGELRKGNYDAISNPKYFEGLSKEEISAKQMSGAKTVFTKPNASEENLPLSRFNQERSNNLQGINAKSQMIAHYGQLRQNYSQALNQMGSAGSSAAQGFGSKAQAKFTAAKDLDSASQQLATGVAQDQGQAMTSAFQSQNSEMQVYSELLRAGGQGS